MSFSSTVKNELCRMENGSHCCLNAELAAIFRVGGVIRDEGDQRIFIRLVTENAALARKTFSLVKQVFHQNPEVVIRRSRQLKKNILYIIGLGPAKEDSEWFNNFGIKVFNELDVLRVEYDNFYKSKGLKQCCRKSFLRGVFLASGSVSDPEKTYHLEMNIHNTFLAEEVMKFAKGFGLHPKVIKRKGNFVVYLKEGENIVDYLNVIGAHGALLDLENIRIVKEMRNNVNRIVNCETANLEKTVSASIRQIEDILFLKEYVGLENLPDSLRETAELRLTYQDANLKELGEMLSQPLGKSGVNHRLKKLAQLCEDFKRKRGFKQ